MFCSHFVLLALFSFNGSGKSTLASLIAGLYHPTGGKIMLSEGLEFDSLSRPCKRRLVQLIQQDAALFNASIFDNVRYCSPFATRDEVRAALLEASCQRLLQKIDYMLGPENDPLDFVVGLDGCRLSGGEKQRLALARALVADPMLLVMDEPAAHLDSEGESAVMDAIAACRGGLTRTGRHDAPARQSRALLLITHQPKLLENVDQVAVLFDGVVVECGTFTNLRTNAQSALCRIMPELLECN
jgi:ABC-type multidrug transport system fused ATPase/permease subunit